MLNSAQKIQAIMALDKVRNGINNLSLALHMGCDAQEVGDTVKLSKLRSLLVKNFEAANKCFYKEYNAMKKVIGSRDSLSEAELSLIELQAPILIVKNQNKDFEEMAYCYFSTFIPFIEDVEKKLEVLEEEIGDPDFIEA